MISAYPGLCIIPSVIDRRSKWNRTSEKCQALSVELWFPPAPEEIINVVSTRVPNFLSMIQFRFRNPNIQVLTHAEQKSLYGNPLTQVQPRYVMSPIVEWTGGM